ncbi:MAG: hypothetical protein K2G55_02975, partial [Lachnospiraceae bacterium]|nr:hypothetical protein [Lachnospiraceae bacterium]MDE7201110.1 hypothetical protein [Lachnospiraceae bacterium]
MVDNMKSYKISQKQIDTIKEALQRYLIYVNKFCMEYADYFNDMDATNELYKKNPAHFFDANGIDAEKFFKDYQEYKLIPIAEKTLKEIENIHTNVIGIFIDPQVNGTVYPSGVHRWLYDFRDYCFDANGNFLSVEKQNKMLAKYPHFDASTKRPKTFITQNK